MPAYLLALCQALASGDNLNGAYLFLGLLFFCSACIWLWMGGKSGRPFMGGLLGLIWFFMPYNLHVLLVQGDLARSMAYCALPLLFFNTRQYLSSPSWKKLPFFGVCFLLLVLTHPGCAALTALAWVVYLVCWRLVCRVGSGIPHLLVMGFAVAMSAGLWLIPYLTGGALRGDMSEAMAASFQPVWDSLNFKNYWSDPRGAVYFGLALLIVCLIAGIFGRKNAAPESRAGIVLLLLTTSAAYTAIRILPGSMYFRAVWLFSAAAALGLLALLHWRTAKKPLTVILTLLLILDAAPAYRLLISDASEGAVLPAEDRMSEVMTAALLDQAQSVTTQRLAVLNEDALGAEGVYLSSLWQEPVPVIGGIGRDQSSLSENLKQLDRALRGGCYAYVFDRCLELGCDTVLVQTALVKDEDLAAGLVEQAAGRLGYRAIANNGSYRLYHCDLGSGWGTITDYPAIGIGSTAGYTSLVYPAMQEASDTNLNHYSFEQLSAYELVFLSGFTYDDRETAEELLVRLSEAGVHVVIAADGIPLDKRTHSRSFLGVLCSNVEFSNGYPELDTVDGILNTKLFPPRYSTWQTVYVEGLDDVWGSVLDNELRLPFYGTVKNDHIVVVGLNLHYFYSLTQDETVGQLLSHGMQLPAGRLPDRLAVPLSVTYGRDSITLSTDYDGVNTALSAHDSFESADIRFSNHLTVIDRGTSTIRLRYPSLFRGAVCTAAGLAAACFLPLWERSRTKKRAKQAVKDGEQT